MRIALLAHVRHPIAPPFMGGMESHCWHLAAGLEARGHEVVLFAAGDSDPRFAVDPVLARHYERDFPWAEHRGSAPLIAHVDRGYAAACDRIAAGGFDVVHNNSLHRFPLEPRRTACVPTVTSLHVPPYDALHWFVKASPAPAHRLTVASEGQLRAWWPDGAPVEASVLHNGIDPAAWPFQPEQGHGAVWSAEVEPLLGDGIRYGGHLKGDALAAELGRAAVFVFTPCWDEPFGLVAIEAMACGLPVAAFDRGAAREVVGEAGSFAPEGDVRLLAEAIDMASTISRAVARQRVMTFFTRDRWLERCEALYREVRN